MPEWETIEVPRGQYIGWGNDVGQNVTGSVLDFDPHGATTVAGDPCPLLEIELSEIAASFDKEGNRVDYPIGDVVCLSVSQKNLQRGIKKAQLRAGDLVKIELTDKERSANGTVKIFTVQVARGAGKPRSNGTAQQRPAAAPAQQSFAGSTVGAPAPGFGRGDDEPPF
ncbi:MAG: hypothetical protein WBZ37_19310 [Mycobacterium sp.]